MNMENGKKLQKNSRGSPDVREPGFEHSSAILLSDVTCYAAQQQVRLTRNTKI